MAKKFHRVFISYCPQNGEIATEICNALEEKGITCYLVTRDIEGKTDYQKELAAAIHQCDVFLPLLSRQCRESNRYVSELGVALANKKSIVPVQLDESIPPTELADYSMIDLSCNKEQGMRLIIDAVREIISGIQADIFLSYDSDDFLQVKWYLEFLEDKKLTCWIAPRDIPYGSNYAREIPKVIKNCKCVLVFVSEKSQSSRQIENELETAVSFQKPIIPVRLEDFEFKECYMYHLKNKQWFDAYIAQEEDLSKLVRNLKELCREAAEEKEESQGSIYPNEKVAPQRKQGSFSGSFRIADHFSGSCSMTIVMHILIVVLIYMVFNNYSDVIMERIMSLIQSMIEIPID